MKQKPAPSHVEMDSAEADRVLAALDQAVDTGGPGGAISAAQMRCATEGALDNLSSWSLICRMNAREGNHNVY